MYEAFFALSQLPFGLTPNTDFFLELPSHRDALQMLKITIDNAEGFIKIVGEVGTGKTLLCRKLLNELESDPRYYSAYIPNPYLTPQELQLAVADELEVGLPVDHSPHILNKCLTERLVELAAENRRVVMVVDEAQAMPPETLEALRLMTNLETESSKLLQVVLFGQPELNRTLAKQEFRQLRQRITFSQPLRALTEQEAEAYIAHRLAIAGYKGIHLFDESALQLLHYASGGIPRLLNILAHKALMVAYGKGIRQVTKAEIRSAIIDTDGVSIQRWWHPARLLRKSA
jgi:MSHA biogenesis protein MshM